MLFSSTFSLAVRKSLLGTDHKPNASECVHGFACGSRASDISSITKNLMWFNFWLLR